MRVISQNRKISVDFDRTVFTNVDETILAKIDGRDVVFGTYKSEKIAKDVFKDIHTAYSGMPLIFWNIQPSENFEQELKEMDHKAIVLPNEPAKVEQNNNSVYYMPEE